MTYDEFIKMVIDGSTHVVTKSGVVYDVDPAAVHIAKQFEDDDRLFVYGYRVSHGKRQRRGGYIRAGTVKWFYLDNVKAA